MRASELRGKTIKDLLNILEEHKKSLEKVAGDVYKGKEKNISKIRFARKDIARILTVINEKKFMEDGKNA